MHSQPGEGSTFWIELADDNARKNNGAVSKTQKATNLQSNISMENKHTVLYIEDNPANLRLVSQLLSRLTNIHMWSAHEPLLGLELAVEHNPDLILLDINLPGMDGYEVLEKLREKEGTRDIPVIAISANAMPRDVEKGKKAGFDDYITKPIDVNSLMKTVESKLA